MKMKSWKNKKGFTLVELIVVLALLSLLFAVAAGGLSAYSRYAERRKDNEYARSIYYAAQSALTHEKASGMLEKLKEQAESSGTSVYLEQEADGARRWILTKEKEGADDMVSSLLEPYIMKDILTDAAVYVEADLEKGIVYAAGYSRKADRFLPEERGVVAVFYGIVERAGLWKKAGAENHETKTQTIKTGPKRRSDDCRALYFSCIFSACSGIASGSFYFDANGRTGDQRKPCKNRSDYVF